MDINIHDRIYDAYEKAVKALGFDPEDVIGRCSALRWIILKFLLSPIWILPVRGIMLIPVLLTVFYKLFMQSSDFGITAIVIAFVIALEIQVLSFLNEAWENRSVHVSDLKHIGITIKDLGFRKSFFHTDVVRLVLEMVLYLVILLPVLYGVMKSILAGYLLSEELWTRVFLFVGVGVVALIVIIYFVIPLSHKLEQNEKICPKIGRKRKNDDL